MNLNLIVWVNLLIRILHALPKHQTLQTFIITVHLLRQLNNLKRCEKTYLFQSLVKFRRKLEF
jgi:hypothetical protein